MAAAAVVKEEGKSVSCAVDPSEVFEKGKYEVRSMTKKSGMLSSHPQLQVPIQSYCSSMASPVLDPSTLIFSPL